MTSASEDLCLSCGLCCDGSLFWAVPIDPDTDADAPVRVDEDGWLRQPCACLNGRACTIYADRPAACRSFDCRVLQAVQAGKRDASWARQQIAAMRQVLADLDKALPGGAPSVYRRAADFLARHRDRLRDPTFQKLNRNLLQRLSAYEQSLAAFHVPVGEKRGKTRG